MTRVPLVGVVDDDESVRESLPMLLQTEGFGVEVYSSAEALLSSSPLSRFDCLILDIRMPGMSGPGLQQELALRHQLVPIIFITAHGDEDTKPRLVSAGAVDCLFKPFREDALLLAVHKALRSR